MKKVYTSIDIGSDTIKIVVGEMINNTINILASRACPSKGIRKGLVVDANLAVNSIKDGIKEINNELGFNIRKVIVNVPTYNAKFLYVQSSIDIESEDKIITNSNITSLIKKAVVGKLDSDYELVTVNPLDFIIDNKKNNSKIVGKKANHVDMKAIMISTPKKNIYSVLAVMEGASLEVVDITVSGICDYYEAKVPSLDKKLGAVINLGHDVTTVSIINKGKLMNTEMLQVGGRNIEKDICKVFGVSIFESRTIKEKFALAHKRFSQLVDTYEVKNTYDENIKLNQLEVSEVAMARLEEILDMAKNQIFSLTKQDINYIIVVGGLTEMKAFKYLVYEIFGKDAIMFNEDILGVRDNKWITALGMIKYLDDRLEMKGSNYNGISESDEELLITPKSKRKDTNKFISKIFNNFISNKEDK